MIASCPRTKSGGPGEKQDVRSRRLGSHHWSRQCRRRRRWERTRMTAGTGAVRSAPAVQGRSPGSDEEQPNAPEPRSTGDAPELPEIGRLSVDFLDEAAAARFVMSLASLLSGVADELVAVD